MFDWLFDTSGFVPRATCGRWSEELLLVTKVAELTIFLAYMAIPLSIVYLSRKRRLPFRKTFWMFAAFISGCGLTHLMGFIVFYHALYHLDTTIKVYTAIVSAATVVCLWIIGPQVLAMRTPEELEEEITQKDDANRRRDQLSEEVRHLNEELEQKVRERTTERQGDGRHRVRTGR